VKAKKEYFISRKKYILAYAEMLDNCMSPAIDLSQPEIREIMVQTLRFWHGVRLRNFAFTVMPNHVHWVFDLYPWDLEGKQVCLQDILQSVKRFSANRINKFLGRTGSLWQKESFDTTIRNERHLQYAIQYTLNNPVKARLAENWIDWPGSGCGCGDF
jgi:REP element-mobilizing transposase RayT